MNTFKLAQFKAETNIEKNQGRTPRHYKTMRIGLVLAAMMFGGVFYGFATMHTPETEAIEPSEFNAGYLIDDSVFYNPNTMTVAEIQKLLDEKSPACDMWGTGLISGRKYPDGTWVPAGTTRAQYAKVMREKYGNAKYHDPPYVCINKYYENPETHQSLYETQGVATAGMKSAAQIIYDVAQEYSINPQVLLVMIKKESLVWGDNWPLKYEYNTVMGYGCPDDAPCNEAYYGFYNQVQKSAWQLKYYREHPTSYRYKPGQNNNIQYHPNTYCGTKQVYLENIATTSLYIYTPYTPNDAALRAYPGTGDGCSSYGNRNFYMFFREWFGDTYSEIDSYYKNLGGSNSYLGEALSYVECGLRNSGCRKKYAVGYIYWSKTTGAWDVSGRIGDKWLALNAENGDLGYPISTERKGLSNNGAFQKFEKGRIYWTSKTGAWAMVDGPIYQKWFSLGTEWSALGYPTSDLITENGKKYQNFENGQIFESEKGVYAVSSEIYEKYKKDGGYNSWGLPISDANCALVKSGCFQKFEKGRIYWTSKTGAWAMVDGPIYQKWFSLGTEWSALGYPTSDLITENGKKYQNFENGTIELINGGIKVIRS